MKKLLLITLALCLLPFAFTLAQEYAIFELTSINQGTGKFNDVALSDFTWQVEGTLYQEVQILDDEVFDDGNQFENMFGQANNAQNLRIQIVPNAIGSIGQPVTSTATLTLDFDQLTPVNKWGFCIVDLDVENCLISAIDENDNAVSIEDIDNWLVELFDADLVEDGINIPKWDASHAALLGSDTPEDYVVYNNLVIGGMPSNEASAAFFKPDIPLKSLVLYFENLQYGANVSLHFYFASLEAAAISEANLPLGFDVYPNPCRDKLTIRNLKLETRDLKLEIFDNMSRLVKSMGFSGHENTIDISDLPAGLYLVKLQTEDAVGVRKIIIK